MNRILRNVLSLMAAIVLTTTFLSACGDADPNKNGDSEITSEELEKDNDSGSDSENQDNDSLSYPVDGANSFSYGMTLAGAWSDRYDSFDELPLGKELENKTGFDMEMIHVENKQAMNLLLASGNLPDVLSYNFQANYSGGEAKAIKDGLIFPMSEEFVKTNAPDYWKVISQNPDILKQVKTPEGDIYGFAFILGDEVLKGGYGLIIRDDWCKELGIEIPETADEFYNMLKAFKEKKGIESPLCLSSGYLTTMLNRGIITSPFGLKSMDIYVENGQVEIGYTKNELLDVLTWLNKLYTEGLLDKNFATLDDETITANMLTGTAGVSVGTAGSKLGTWLSTNKNVEDFSLGAGPNLVKNKGDIPFFGHYNTDVVGGVTAISTACENPEEVAKFINYGYTDEGHMLYNFGIEGKSYELKDGKAVYTDLVLNNPDGLSPQQALSEYQLAYGNGPFVQDKEYLMQYYSTDEQKNALEVWGKNDAKKYKLPRVTINAEESGEYASLISELETYRDEMIIKFVRGEISLDSFESYQKTLENMGVNRLQEIVQKAYDEYQSR